MSNNGINEKAFTEGDNITFKCDGGVGRPKGKFMWQKIYSSEQSFNYTSRPTETIPENCTYSGTSNLTIQVTAEDNHAKIRCIVESDVSKVKMFADSEPLLIYCKYMVILIFNYYNLIYTNIVIITNDLSHFVYFFILDIFIELQGTCIIIYVCYNLVYNIKPKATGKQKIHA